ncbi:MAG: hypothetical protein HUU57_02955 [Bdellovibrio sp.]|nr:hypothetical protein [Bdellovibrio sp.]
MTFRIFETAEFHRWFRSQNIKTQLIVTARIERLQVEGHWGFVNRFDSLIELKWALGMRIYTSLIENTVVVILLGGNKNGQSKDIKKAKKLLQEVLEGI